MLEQRLACEKAQTLLALSEQKFLNEEALHRETNIQLTQELAELKAAAATQEVRLEQQVFAMLVTSRIYAHC